MPEDSEPRPAADPRVNGEPVIAGPAGVPPAPAEPPATDPLGETAIGGPPLAEPAVGAAGPTVGAAGPAAAGAGPVAAGTDPKPASQRWSARAAVPASRDADETGSQWVFDPGRGVVLPALIAVMILLLLGLLALGIWLIVRSDAEPNPNPTSSTGPTTSVATTAPTQPTSTLKPVVLEDYRGRPFDEVSTALTTLGLTPQRVDQTNGEIAAGMVIGTDPAAGSTVAPGLTVTVFVSLGPPTPPPTTPPPTTPPSPSP
ncbi:MAG: PASTA domain-containing protein [Micromonosporaceae bacterium]